VQHLLTLAFCLYLQASHGQSIDSIYIFIDQSDFDSINDFYTVHEFDSLLNAHSGVLRNLDIRIGKTNDEVLYEQSAIDGLTTVQRKSPGVYRFYEYWILPMTDMNFFGQVHLFSFDADLNSGKITADTGTLPGIHVWEQSFPAIIAAFDSLEAYERAHPTDENWDNVTQQQWITTEKVACQLALAAINGCEPCRLRLGKVRQTFNYMYAAGTIGVLTTYERMVWRHEQIWRKTPWRKNWSQPFVRF
jgi:hypothetical protein